MSARVRNPAFAAALVLALVAAAPVAAHAGGADGTAAVEAVAPPPMRYGAALSLLSLHDRGVAGEGEMSVSDHWSVVGALGLRSGAADDYSSLTLSAGGEARYWLRRRAVWSSLRGMVGWYFAGRVDVARTGERDKVDGRDLGAELAVAGSALAGYRFAPWRGLTITPSVGLSVRTEYDLSGRLAPWTQGGFVTALTVGWLF